MLVTLGFSRPKAIVPTPAKFIVESIEKLDIEFQEETIAVNILDNTIQVEIMNETIENVINVENFVIDLEEDKEAVTIS